MSNKADKIKFMNALYSDDRIEMFERIWGDSYVSPGGEEYTERFIRDLELDRPDMKVLDVGCGAGGAAIKMAKEHKANVIGIDLSANMIAKSNKYRSLSEPGVKYRIQFHVEDALEEEYPEDYFDAVHSRDVILHIPNKNVLFKKLFGTLKRGGVLMFTDYAKGEVEDLSEGFLKYVDTYKYDFYTAKEYKTLLEETGFVDVRLIDITRDLIKLNLDDLARWDELKNQCENRDVVKQFGEMREAWVGRVERCRAGEQKWVQLIAKKPFL